MSATELEARQWQAAIGAVYGRNDLRLVSEKRGEWMQIMIEEATITEESIALMKELGCAFLVHLQCRVAEWAEMLAQGGK